MKAVIVYSGGMDSSVLLAYTKKMADEVVAVSFDYGQRHKRELEYAARFCAQLGVSHKVVDITNINELVQGSSLTSDDIAVPDGHYADASMKATVVPNRNMIMLSLAIGYAVSLGYDTVATAVHAGDHAIYPDCRPEFIDAMAEAAKVANYVPIRVFTPFIKDTKTDIVRLGKELGVDFDLTWSCYKGVETHCGTCGTCVERLEALALA